MVSVRAYFKSSSKHAKFEVITEVAILNYIPLKHNTANAGEFVTSSHCQVPGDLNLLAVMQVSSFSRG